MEALRHPHPSVKPERRFVEFRAEGEGVIAGTVVRYGDVAAFGEWSETFEPGSLTFDDPIVNLMHRREAPVARLGAGLTLSDSTASLTARVDPPDTRYGREARELVEARILRGFSMEFVAEDERLDGRRRVVRAARLVGIGLVDRPAYPDSAVAARFAEAYGAPRRARRRRFRV